MRSPPAGKLKSMIKTLEWTAAGVRFLDQTKLPTEESYATCRTYQEVAEAIRSMVVRGAPAIGVAAAMGVALGVRDSSARNSQELRREFEQICQTLAATRPTAVNLFWALERMRGKFEALENQPLGDIKQALIEEALRMHAEDIAANIAMGRHGAALMPARRGVPTHWRADSHRAALASRSHPHGGQTRRARRRGGGEPGVRRHAAPLRDRHHHRARRGPASAGRIAEEIGEDFGGTKRGRGRAVSQNKKGRDGSLPSAKITCYLFF